MVLYWFGNCIQIADLALCIVLVQKGQYSSSVLFADTSFTVVVCPYVYRTDKESDKRVHENAPPKLIGLNSKVN